MVRVYSKLKNNIRLGILVVTSFLWLPFWALTYIGSWLADILDYLDDQLDNLIDKFISKKY